MTQAPCFYTLGNVTVDDLVFSDGRTRMGIPGGNGVYSTLGLRVWGAHVAIVSICGPDYPLAALVELGVSLSHMKATLPATLRNWGLYEEDGTRQFVFRGLGVRWEDFSPSPADLPSSRGGHYHIAPLPLEHQLALVQDLREVHKAQTISLDPDDRTLATIDHARLKLLLSGLDVFLPSRQEAAALFPGLTPQGALLAIRDLCPEIPVVVVKLGRDGAIFHGRGEAEITRVPAFHGGAIDPTGAGDAFCGGFLYGYALSRDPLEAALSGTISASFAVEGVGIDGLMAATVAEAQSRLATLRSAVGSRVLKQL